MQPDLDKLRGSMVRVSTLSNNFYGARLSGFSRDVITLTLYSGAEIHVNHRDVLRISSDDDDGLTIAPGYSWQT